MCALHIDPIQIDGSRGEGGGQVLRTSLTLSLVTGRPFLIEGIRAKRSKPGLLRQHLTSVQAAAAVGDAEVEGASTASQRLFFRPRTIRGGNFDFPIGTAGSCTLVLQTVLPALLAAGVGAQIRLSGGTHNPHAPPADALQHAFLPLLHRMGAEIECSLIRHGFYPAGGGELTLKIASGRKLKPLNLMERGKLRNSSAVALISALPIHIANRELNTLGRTLGWHADQLKLRGLADDRGPGNALVATIEHDHVTEVFTTFGEKRVSAEKVAGRLCRQVREYLDSGVPVGPFLADQLLLPLAIAGGSFSTGRLTPHSLTNLQTIHQFLPDRLLHREGSNGRVVIQTKAGQAAEKGSHRPRATKIARIATPNPYNAPQ